MLGALAEGPTHGFAVARLLGPDGALGHIWTLPRPVVYQAVNKLTERELVAPRATERSDRGPNRTILAVTANGRRVIDLWLRTPVAHVRDARSELLLKLALLDRAGADPSCLIAAQRTTLTRRMEFLRADLETGEGFERLLVVWRVASVQAVLDFLAAVAPPRT